MKKQLFRLLAVAIMTAFSSVAWSQVTVKGQLVDKDTSEPLVGAAIVVQGTSQGVVSDVDGYFTQRVEKNATLVIKYVGYKEQSIKISQSGNVDLGAIKMVPESVVLKDVTITSSVAVARKTPIAVSSVDPVFIEEKLGTKEFPEILNSTPGVYATKQGGGYGDSKLNLRGFKSENIAVMINGVPMNDMEWGGLYWSNWAGLSDVTRSMQVQRGLGASKVSAPSVGGSINIITKATDAKKGGSAFYAMGNDGYNKMMFTVSTGMSKKGWAMTLLGGKTWGDGYIQGTDFEAYNWFVNIAKRINDSHQLSLTAFAAPQWHNQRSNYDGLTIEGWQTVGKKYMNGESAYKYNPTYGFGPNGERKYSAHNVYNKPQISLNHVWQINEKSSLNTALYTSIGRGYGYSGQTDSANSGNWYGANNGILNEAFHNPDGTYNYSKIYDLNAASENGSVMVMSKSKNYHNWYGLLSTYTTKLNENFDFYGGVDLRYYKGVHTNELVDLYGGDYYIDRYRNNVRAVNNSAVSQLGSAFTNKKLQVGDIVYRDYDGFTMSEGVFGQLEYNREKLSAFVSGAVSNTSYWRYDRFYYDADHAKSKTVSFIGWNAKGGLNFNITENHNVFANVGYISRAPFFSGGAFLNSTVSNFTNDDAVNEKIFSVELGYGFRSKYLQANVNIYHTAWMDKLMTRSTEIYASDGSYIDRVNLNLSGVDAVHEGIEFDFVAKPLNWLDIRGMLSLGDWRWDSTAKGYFYDSGSQPVASWNSNGIVNATGIQTADHASMTVNLNGVKVGGSAQTTAAMGVDAKVSKAIKVGANCNFYGRNYADWAFSSSDLLPNGEKTYESPWRMPSAWTFDLNASYRFDLGGVRATLSGNVDNVFNQEYIMDAYDGANHDWKTAYRVFYGFGRTFNVRLKLNF